MSLWVDKYRPTTLAKLDYHLDQAQYLKHLVQSGDFPNLLVYGPSGAGKKTRIMCLLRELYGPGADRLRMGHQTFVAPSKKRVDICTVSSNYHVEVTPSDAGIYDRVIVQELIKNMAQTHQLDAGSQKNFKVVVLNEVDHLSKDAQHALRRTMEKYISTCRLILCSNSTSRVIPAIRSRCLAIRVPAPTHDQIVHILQTVCKKEGVNIPVELARCISEKSGRNLRRALLMCEACRVQQYPFTVDQSINEPDWLLYLRETASLILKEQSPKQLLEVRSRIYELLSHCIPAEIIFKTLLKELIINCDDQLKVEITKVAASYEHRLHLGSKPIYHLEAFVAKYMSVYLTYLEESLAAFCD